MPAHFPVSVHPVIRAANATERTPSGERVNSGSDGKWEGASALAAGTFGVACQHQAAHLTWPLGWRLRHAWARLPGECQR
jgi:hypothetical protein